MNNFTILNRLATATVLSVSLVASAQSTSSVPRVTGNKTANGIRLASHESANLFAIEITGRDIKPQSADRLIWMVDGKRIELMSARPPAGLQQSAPDLVVLQAFQKSELESLKPSGWTRVGAEEQWAFPTGEKCLFFAVARGDWEHMEYAATVNGDFVVVLVSSAIESKRLRENHDYLQRTLLSLQRGKASEKETLGPDPHQFGGTLSETIEVNEALTGRTYAALLNNKIMTPADAKLSAVVPADPVTMEEIAVFLLETGRSFFEVIIFDGQKAHAIDLTGYDHTTNTVMYFDPWGKRSFLAAGSNHAGISAMAHPTEKRRWLIKSDELGRVLYAIVLEFAEIVEISRISTLLAGNPDTAIVTYKELQSENPGAVEISEKRLHDIQDFLLRRRKFQQAVTMYRIRVALYPDSISDKSRIAGVLQATGQQSLMVDLDRPPVWPSSARPLRVSLSAAKNRTDFFTFFHLEQVGSFMDENHRTVVSFKPTASQFHDLVELQAVLDPDNIVSSWRLALARSFIDDANLREFANDIVSAFILFAVVGAEADAAGDTIREINRGGVRYVPLPGARVGGTSIVAVGPQAYLTYANRSVKKSYAHWLTGGILRVENVNIGRLEYLTILVASH